MNTLSISKKALAGFITSAILLALTPFYASIADAQVTLRSKTSVNLTCMQTAVDVREDAVADAFGDFNDDVETALAARKTALHDAWGLSDKTARNTAVKSAWTTWKAAKKSAHTDLKSARKAAWTTFKTTAKSSCKETLPREEALEKDAAGTVSL
jgi:hypothetical protein